jgi:plasmid stabilization system protein ParE
MSRSLRIIARARADIDRIYDWLKSRSPQGAASWYDALFEAVARIAESPDSYAIASEALPR